MSSGMNMQEAKKVAEQMSYRQAVLNCLNARCVPFRKATKIKMKQLLESIDNDFTDDLLNMGYTKGYQNGRADAIDEFKKDIINKIDFEDKWLFACKSNNADTSIMFSVLRSFVNNRAEQLKEKKNG